MISNKSYFVWGENLWFTTTTLPKPALKLSSSTCLRNNLYADMLFAVDNASCGQFVRVYVVQGLPLVFMGYGQSLAQLITKIVIMNILL